VGAGADTGLGDVREVCVVSERLGGLLAQITPEYYLFAVLPAGAAMGRARFVLRLASLALEGEFR
jgi:hypothetical protein